MGKREKIWVKKCNSRCLSDIDTWQSTSLFNGQHSIEASGTNIARFYKTGGPNVKLEQLIDQAEKGEDEDWGLPQI